MHIRLIYNGVEHVLGVSVIPVTPAAQRITENQCPVVSVADFHETLNLAAPHEILYNDMLVFIPQWPCRRWIPTDDSFGIVPIWRVGYVRTGTRS